MVTTCLANPIFGIVFIFECIFIFGFIRLFVGQKAAAPKNGVEFCHKSIGTMRRSLATSYNVWRRRATSPKSKNTLTDELTD